MSKASSSNAETLDELETSSSTETTSTSVETTENKMGLSKFLRLHPQNIYVNALLDPFKSQAMTEQEWLNLVTELLNKKITC